MFRQFYDSTQAVRLTAGTCVRKRGNTMQKEKLPGREQVVTSIRLNEKTNEYIKIKASEIGISQNAFMMVLIDLGIRVYESEVSFNPQSG